GNSVQHPAILVKAPHASHLEVLRVVWRRRIGIFLESEQSVRQKCHGALETARAKQLRTLHRSERECPRCGRKFSPKRIDGRYCSAACKQAAYRCRTVGKLTHSRGLYGRRLAQT